MKCYSSYSVTALLSLVLSFLYTNRFAIAQNHTQYVDNRDCIGNSLSPSSSIYTQLPHGQTTYDLGNLSLGCICYMICAYDMSKSISYSILYVILQTMEDVSSAQSLKVLHFLYQIMMNYRIIVNKCAMRIHYAQHILLEGRLYYMRMNIIGE